MRKRSEVKNFRGDSTYLMEFQKNYIDVWKSAYAAALSNPEICTNADTEAGYACDNFFEAFGKPNNLWFTDKEYDIVMHNLTKWDN